MFITPPLFVSPLILVIAKLFAFGHGSFPRLLMDHFPYFRAKQSGLMTCLLGKGRVAPVYPNKSYFVNN